MVSGRGQPIGPDLSNVGEERTLGQIQSVLKEPRAHITPGYELVTVKLRNGNTLRGFARNRSNFDIHVEDLQGKLHLLEEGQIVSIVQETQSVMPPVKATPEEWQDLLAYLSAGCYADLRPPPDPAGFRQVRALAFLIAVAVNVVTI